MRLVKFWGCRRRPLQLMALAMKPRCRLRSVATLAVTCSLILMYLIATDNVKHFTRMFNVKDCPAIGVVSVQAGGRLGNSIWEYAATFVVALRTGMKPLVPFEIRDYLDTIFTNLSVPATNMRRCARLWTQNVHGSLRDAPNSTSIQLTDFIGPWYHGLIKIVFSHQSDIRREFKIHPHLEENAQRVLLSTKPEPETVFVGVHVRRADYSRHLRVLYNTTLIGVGFYLRAMDYFRDKYANTVFVVASDDPTWCRAELVGEHTDVFVTEGSSPQDFATLAACNHSIFDYGTFGEWSSFLAGGETIVYNLTMFQDHSSNLATIFDHWHVMS